MDIEKPNTNTLGWRIEGMKGPALLKLAFRDLKFLTAEWRTDSKAVPTNWDVHAVDDYRMTPMLCTPVVIGGVTMKGKRLSRTVCFYLKGICVATMIYYGDQIEGKKNRWLLSAAVIFQMDTGALPELFAPPEDADPLLREQTGGIEG